jgi:hypothetical protein
MRYLKRIGAALSAPAEEERERGPGSKVEVKVQQRWDIAHTEDNGG